MHQIEDKKVYHHPSSLQITQKPLGSREILIKYKRIKRTPSRKVLLSFLGDKRHTSWCLSWCTTVSNFNIFKLFWLPFSLVFTCAAVYDVIDLVSIPPQHIFHIPLICLKYPPWLRAKFGHFRRFSKSHYYWLKAVKPMVFFCYTSIFFVILPCFLLYLDLVILFKVSITNGGITKILKISQV